MKKCYSWKGKKQKSFCEIAFWRILRICQLVANVLIKMSHTKNIKNITEELIANIQRKFFSALAVWYIKGYLCFEMITSQNVSSVAQVKNFLFHRKVMFHSQDIQVLVFLTIQWFTKSVTSWEVLYMG